MNMVVAIDMSDAPMTKDTITAGSDEDDEDQGDNDQDATVTQDTITAGGGSEDDDDEDNSGQNNNDNNDNEPATEIKDTPNCPSGQEHYLFSASCQPIPAASSDVSETNTDQPVNQKNTGSGDSANFNCGENLIKAGIQDQECEFED
jgi:hypothetical protein